MAPSAGLRPGQEGSGRNSWSAGAKISPTRSWFAGRGPCAAITAGAQRKRAYERKNLTETEITHRPRISAGAYARKICIRPIVLKVGQFHAMQRTRSALLNVSHPVEPGLAISVDHVRHCCNVLASDGRSTRLPFSVGGRAALESATRRNLQSQDFPSTARLSRACQVCNSTVPTKWPKRSMASFSAAGCAARRSARPCRRRKSCCSRRSPSAASADGHPCRCRCGSRARSRHRSTCRVPARGRT